MKCVVVDARHLAHPLPTRVVAVGRGHVGLRDRPHPTVQAIRVRESRVAQRVAHRVVAEAPRGIADAREAVARRFGRVGPGRAGERRHGALRLSDD